VCVGGGGVCGLIKRYGHEVQRRKTRIGSIVDAGANVLDSVNFGVKFIRDTNHEFDVEEGGKGTVDTAFSRGDLSTDSDEEEEFPSGAGMRVCFKVPPPPPTHTPVMGSQAKLCSTFALTSMGAIWG